MAWSEAEGRVLRAEMFDGVGYVWLWEGPMGQREHDGCPVVWQLSAPARLHARTATNLYRAMLPAADAHGCEVLANVSAVYGRNVCVPDLVVDWDGSGPCLVVEVHSPTTRMRDLFEKRAAYNGTPSVRAYLMIDLERQEVTVDSRSRSGPWGEKVYGRDQLIELECPPLALAVNSVFA